MPLRREEVLRKLRNKKDEIKNFESKRKRKIGSYLKKIKNLDSNKLKDLTGFCGAKPLEGGDFVKKFEFDDLDDWISKSLEQKIIGGVDGSQISPQKNYDIPIGLVNSVLVGNDYSNNERFFTKEISIITPEDFELGSNYSFSKDLINAERDKLERQISIDFLKEDYPNSYLFIDGPLVLSHINKMKKELRDKYLEKITSLLEKSRENNVPVIGFVDTSYSCDLTYMLDEAGICEKEDKVYDAILIDKLLEGGDRTELFTCHRDDKTSINQTPALANYGEFQDRITFFYINLGEGSSCRVELPKWCFEKGIIEEVADIIRCEAYKGDGYPLILNKAHKEAVITYSEEKTFQKMVREISSGNISLKEIRKGRGKQDVYW
ncbi:hypothetical protein C9439_01340 [archaeon SCG-AAA382B04]|nr:hypothetical protein C9439_01340 [archaeon SCG-AAA382B04]